MNNFTIIKLNTANFGYLVIATSYVSPLGNLSEIEEQIKEFSGKVLFDLTLINGKNSNRYIQSNSVESKFDLKSFTIVNDLEDEIREVSRNFFKEHIEIVEQSTISNSLKFLLKKGVGV